MAESSGKTLIATRMMASVQKQGGTCALLDFENAFDPEFAKKLGLNPDDVLISQPETLEQGCEILRALIKSDGIDLIVFDSVAAATPKASLDEEVGKATIGVVARILSPFLRELVGEANRHGVTCVFINQLVA